VWLVTVTQLFCELQQEELDVNYAMKPEMLIPCNDNRRKANQNTQILNLQEGYSSQQTPDIIQQFTYSSLLYCAKLLTYFSLSPSHFDIRSDDDTLKNVELFASVATALAR